nr:hypothetical protein DVH24_019739 [Ipomoea batatas]
MSFLLGSGSWYSSFRNRYGLLRNSGRYSITIAASASRSNFTTSQLTPFTAICNAVCPFLSVLRANCGSLSSSALRMSTCPCLAAKCNAFFPLDLEISTKLHSASQPFENRYHRVFASPPQDRPFEQPNEARCHCACPSPASHISSFPLGQSSSPNSKAPEQVLLLRMEMGLVMAHLKDFDCLLDCPNLSLSLSHLQEEKPWLS